MAYINIPNKTIPYFDNDYIGIYRNEINIRPNMSVWTKPITNDNVDNNDTNINYDLEKNSYCFRSQEFYNLDSKYKNILIAGCSETFGWEVPYEYTWPNILNSHIKNDFDTQLFSVAYPGASIHANIRNIYAFIENYGKPDYIFIYFPDSGRNLFFYEGSLHNVYQGHNIKESVEYTKKFSHESQILSYSTMIFGLEKYCEAAGIKLIWSTWCADDFIFYKNLKFKNFFELIKKYDHIEHLKSKEVEKFWDKAFDKAHLGYRDHAAIALEFYSKMKEL